jgi:hypothetical protein
MGTRGLVGYQLDGKLCALYNHFDSYPDGLGTKVVSCINSFLRPMEDSYETLILKAAQSLDWTSDLDQIVPPIKAEELPALLSGRVLGLVCSNKNVRDYYTNPTPLFNEADFLKDPLFCEWAYILDLDKKEFLIRGNGAWLSFPLFKIPKDWATTATTKALEASIETKMSLVSKNETR